MQKRWLSIALALCMVFSLLPFGAAAEDPYPYPYEITDGHVTLTYTDKATGDLVIPDTIEGYPVTEVGGWAFQWSGGLTSVVIPDSVTAVRFGAFHDCRNLKSVQLPKDITVIEQATFQWSGLESIEIPDKVGVIEQEAFLEAADLSYIVLPVSLGMVGTDAFKGCSSLQTVYYAGTEDQWNSIAIDEGNEPLLNADIHFNSSAPDPAEPDTTPLPEYVASGECGAEGDNVTWTLDKDGLLTISGTGNMKDYYPNTVPWAAYDKQITAVSIGSGVTNIGNYTFYQYTNLTRVEIPESVASIGFDVFYECSSLTDVKLPNGVTSIGDSAFTRCSGLTSMEIPNSVSNIGSTAFFDCSGLTEVKLGSGVTNIGQGAFASCTGLTSIEIPDSVTSIGANAFDDCTGLTSVTIPGSVSDFGDRAFIACTGLTSVKIEDGVTGIGAYAFSKCSSLKNIEIPGSVTSIGEFPFSGCSALTSVEFGDGVTSIVDFMFQDCISLASVKLPNSLTSIGNSAFCECASLTSVALPDSLTSIGPNAFRGCTGLTAVEIPDRVTSIGNGSFYGCTGLTSVKVGDSAVTIEGNSFNGCKQLKTVTLPKTLEDVGASAFDGTRVTDVYYNGTQKQWDSILIRTGNEPLLKATLHLSDEVKPTPAPTAQPTTKPEVKNPFTDVAKDQYYAEPVLWAVNHDPQITAGTSATTFSPANPCTRGQIVTFLWRAKGCPEPTITKNPFTDVKSSDYFYKAVLWAVEKGITAGTSATTFSPAATVTRAQTVTFLWRAEGKPAAETKNPFTDVPAGQYYTDAVLWAVKNNITAGTSATTFSPGAACTRAQIVTFLYRDLAK